MGEEEKKRRREEEEKKRRREEEKKRRREEEKKDEDDDCDRYSSDNNTGIYHLVPVLFCSTTIVQHTHSRVSQNTRHSITVVPIYY